MLKDTPSLNKPRKVMAKFNVANKDAQEVVNTLKIFRSGWANDIRENWKTSIPGAQEITYQLYEISGTIILAMENYLKDNRSDRMPLFLTQKKLTDLVKSKEFEDLDALGTLGVAHIITTGTKHHIRVLFECLETLLA